MRARTGNERNGRGHVEGTKLTTGQASSHQIRRDTEQVCNAYWKPIYAKIRRRGYSWYEAEDLTQDFFAHLLKRGRLLRGNPQQDNYPAFLSCSLNHFLMDEADRRHAQKRCGQSPTVPWEDWMTLQVLGPDPHPDETPVGILDRRETEKLLERAMTAVRRRYRRAGKTALYGLMKPFIADVVPRDWYVKTAPRLHMKPGAVKMAMHRLRRSVCEEFSKALNLESSSFQKPRIHIEKRTAGQPQHAAAPPWLTTTPAELLGYEPALVKTEIVPGSFRDSEGWLGIGTSV